MEKNKKQESFFKPPTSQEKKTNQIFSESFVRMHGEDYYLRIFTDGSAEFTRYDADAMKWMFLVFPAV